MSEYETIILLNDSDLDEGFFTFGTSKVGHYRKILKKLGKETLIDIKITKSPEGKDWYWHLKIPVSCLSKSHFGIRKPKRSGAKRAGPKNPTWLLKSRKKKQADGQPAPSTTP